MAWQLAMRQCWLHTAIAQLHRAHRRLAKEMCEYELTDRTLEMVDD